MQRSECFAQVSSLCHPPLPPPPSATDPVKPDPVDFFASAGENLASPVHGEILNFTRPVVTFPVQLLQTQRISFVFV